MGCRFPTPKLPGRAYRLLDLISPPDITITRKKKQNEKKCVSLGRSNHQETHGFLSFRAPTPNPQMISSILLHDFLGLYNLPPSLQSMETLTPCPLPFPGRFAHSPLSQPASIPWPVGVCDGWLAVACHVAGVAVASGGVVVAAVVVAVGGVVVMVVPPALDRVDLLGVVVVTTPESGVADAHLCCLLCGLT